MTVSKGKLKAKMLEYFREVERTGEPLIVTDHGREVLEVRPVRKTSSVEEILAEYRAGPGKGVVNCSEEELLAPEALEDWEALKEDETEKW
jgi:prevent-host-death family protein